MKIFLIILMIIFLLCSLLSIGLAIYYFKGDTAGRFAGFAIYFSILFLIMPVVISSLEPKK